MRSERVADQIRTEIASLLEYEVKDPGLGFLTVTRVRVTPDLQAAHVYYTTLGDTAARRQTTRALGRAVSFLRRQMATRLQLRRTPELHFHYDEAIAQQERVERLLEEIATERAERGDEARPPDHPDELAPSRDTTDDDHADEPDSSSRHS